MQETLLLWGEIMNGKYEAYISDIVFEELNACNEPKRSFLAQKMNEIEYFHIKNTSNALELAEKFIDFGILREKCIDDCQHIAIAIISDCDIIVSWNFKHIVNPKTIRGVKTITTSEGYRDLMICTPTMLIGGDNDD